MSKEPIIREILAKKTKDLKAEEFSFAMEYYISRNDGLAAKTLARELTRSRHALDHLDEIIHKIESLSEDHDSTTVKDVLEILKKHQEAA